jgi:Leucine-rich repeat (LRR) protein
MLHKSEITDLSPLKGMPLRTLAFSLENAVSGIDAVREVTTLETIECYPEIPKTSPAEFWKMYDAQSAPVAQLRTVIKQLRELNPDYDGSEEHKIEGGAVTDLTLIGNQLKDISPVRSLTGLKRLHCGGKFGKDSALSDISPLKGMKLEEFGAPFSKVADLAPLTGMDLERLDVGVTRVADLSFLEFKHLEWLSIAGTQIRDLEPLRGAPLVELHCENTQTPDFSPLRGAPLKIITCDNTRISNLSPLAGMPLEQLDCGGTLVHDLSPLKGLPLITLTCENTLIEDLSPLEGMQLKKFYFSPETVKVGLEKIRVMKSLERIGVGWGKPDYAPEEFWKKLDAGDFNGGAVNSLPQPSSNDAELRKAEEELAKVISELRRLNPDFDGHEGHKTADGAVVELDLAADHLVDISPLHTLAGLKTLRCNAKFGAPIPLPDIAPLHEMHLEHLELLFTKVQDLSPLAGMDLNFLELAGNPCSDLSPLKGMKLTWLGLWGTQVTDVSGLRGMPISEIHLGRSRIADVSPLRGAPLKTLICEGSKISNLSPLADAPIETVICDDTLVADLSPLKKMPLSVLKCSGTPVTDLTPIAGLQLTELAFSPKRITAGIDGIRRMKSLEKIGISWNEPGCAPADFWKKYDAGRFGLPPLKN